ncbi:phosphotransferase family protein [Microvirga sp.]|uniref:phosphotransferase family protein n=1 Tax=Microvirga sp. TaxID=1873136 RepID=UPI001FEE0720|nr:phosphotransferase family protein [Microvirga sp.]
MREVREMSSAGEPRRQSTGLIDDDAFKGTKPLEDAGPFDLARLDAWLAANVEHYRGPLDIRQFKGGQSNPTYHITSPSGSLVLRRKPFGALLPSAHAVDREFRVISALHRAGFPVPTPYALCLDGDVIGTTFYVMEMMQGDIYWNALLPGASPERRRRIFRSQVETLAQLHHVDYAALGLSDYARPGNYFERQVIRWTKQYRSSETEHIQEVENLISWLPQSLPAQERVSIVHGDYRLDNTVFGNDDRIKAVLDWELSTLGDPLADFTYFLMQWAMPPDGRSGLAGVDLKSLGIPDIDEVISLYCGMTGRSDLPDLNWYFAYNLFRLVGILQGIAGRVRDGTASSEKAREMAARTRPLAMRAWDFAQKAEAGQ